MPHVVWSARAQSDLKRLYNFLAEHSDTAAIRTMITIHAGVTLLKRHPQSGRMIFDSNDTRREWIMPFGRGAYIVAYDVLGDEIVITAVRHSREDSSTEIQQ